MTNNEKKSGMVAGMYWYQYEATGETVWKVRRRETRWILLEKVWKDATIR